MLWTFKAFSAFHSGCPDMSKIAPADEIEINDLQYCEANKHQGEFTDDGNFREGIPNDLQR